MYKFTVRITRQDGSKLELPAIAPNACDLAESMRELHEAAYVFVTPTK